MLEHIQIQALKAFEDNYIWLIFNKNTRQATVVDPGDSRVVETALTALSLNLSSVLITHHHWDHTTGIQALTQARNIPVFGPAAEKIEGVTHPLGQGDTITLPLLDIEFSILSVPGHTLGHIAYYSISLAQPFLLCGDTLFACGCGRLFEGSPQQMHQSLQNIATLPSETLIYCTHEYTLANMDFALAVEPGNTQLQQRQTQAQAIRSKDKPTLPSTLATELATNPFLRCDQPEVISSVSHHCKQTLTDTESVFSELRAWKDSF